MTDLDELKKKLRPYARDVNAEEALEFYGLSVPLVLKLIERIETMRKALENIISKDLHVTEKDRHVTYAKYGKIADVAREALKACEGELK